MDRRTYRASGGKVGGIAILLGLPTATGVLTISDEDNIPRPVKILLGVGLTGIAVLIVASLIRVRTIVDDDGVTVRGLIRTRRIPWLDVREFRVQRLTIGLNNVGGAGDGVFVYDDDGRRIQLPPLNEGVFGGANGLRREVDTLNRLRRSTRYWLNHAAHATRRVVVPQPSGSRSAEGGGADVVAGRGGQRRVAGYLLAHGADRMGRPGYTDKTAAEVAAGPDTRRELLVAWIRDQDTNADT
jgi:hypothetical protein